MNLVNQYIYTDDNAICKDLICKTIYSKDREIAPIFLSSYVPQFRQQIHGVIFLKRKITETEYKRLYHLKCITMQSLNLLNRKHDEERFSGVNILSEYNKEDTYLYFEASDII